MHEIKSMLKDMVHTDHTQIIEQKSLTKMYEDCKKISTLPSRSSVSPSKRGGDIFNLIDTFKSKIENEFSYLKIQSRKLDERIKVTGATSSDACLKEIENFRTIVQSTQEMFDKEKYFLFKDLNAQKNLNPIIVANIQNDLERNLNEKYLEFSNLIKHFYAVLPPTTGASCITTKIVTTQQTTCDRSVSNMHGQILRKENAENMSRK